VVRIGTVRVDALRLGEAIDAIGALVRSGRGGAVFTPNADHVVRLALSPRFREAYAVADLRLADGMPLVWASRALGGAPLPERVAGADLLLPLARRAAREGWSAYVLGGGPGVAEAAARRLADLGVAVAGVDAPRIDPATPSGRAAAEAAARRVAAARPHLLLVGLGSPKQEEWIARQLPVLRPAVALGVGAALAFLSGAARRAPPWMARAGLEWAHRLASEPRRLWRRYLVDAVAFGPVVLAGRLTSRSSRRAARAPRSPRPASDRGTA
jgi:N-acetylglucosaminyldiphosphoundecaprenol N-acetyl-beta-D-mannosaminyltransferase